jgi:hypothetical protein
LPLICLGNAEQRNEKGRPSRQRIKTLYWRLPLWTLSAVIKFRVSSRASWLYDLFMAVHERELKKGVAL